MQKRRRPRQAITYNPLIELGTLTVRFFERRKRENTKDEQRGTKGGEVMTTMRRAAEKEQIER
ncbi:hypothetical protein MYX84_07455 [Acidobacteria bacterium AH-259-O06]|nr:hypothetical protein [Acidobacteria bacterium AH-259-O06]